MTVATHNHNEFIESATRDMVSFRTPPVVFSANSTPRIICAETFQRGLPAAFTFAINFVHFNLPLDDDAIDLLKRVTTG